MNRSKKAAENLLCGIKVEFRNRERANLEAGVKRFESDLADIAIPESLPWLVRVTMPHALERLRNAYRTINERRLTTISGIQVLNALDAVNLERRYGDAARNEFKQRFPDESEMLDRIAHERSRIGEAARSATINRGFLVKPFTEKKMDVVVLSEKFEYGGSAFRFIDEDAGTERQPLHYIVYEGDIPRSPALGTLRLNTDDEVHTIFDFNELPFSAQTTLPTRALEDAQQSNFGAMFRKTIVDSMVDLTYDENYITMSIVNSLQRPVPWEIVMPGGVAIVHLRTYKQISAHETATGDLCIIVERSAPDISGVGVCYLEAKRRYLKPPIFKMLTASQLNRIREHTNYSALLLYDPTQDDDWICSTIRAQDVLTADANLKDVGLVLSEHGMPFCDRLVTKYFRLDEMDRKEETVKSAAREARRRYAETLLILVGGGKDVFEARQRIERMDRQLDHLVEYGMTLEEHQRGIERQRRLDRSIGDRGLDRGR
jgi:hypothetical protein